MDNGASSRPCEIGRLFFSLKTIDKSILIVYYVLVVKKRQF